MTPYLGNEGKKLPSFWRYRRPLTPVQRRPRADSPSPRGATFGVAGPGSPGGPGREGVPLFEAHPGTWWDLVVGWSHPALAEPGAAAGTATPGMLPRCGVSESGTRFIGDRLMSNNWVTMAKSIPKILFCFPKNSLPIFSFPLQIMPLCTHTNIN